MPANARSSEVRLRKFSAPKVPMTKRPIAPQMGNSPHQLGVNVCCLILSRRFQSIQRDNKGTARPYEKSGSRQHCASRPAITRKYKAASEPNSKMLCKTPRSEKPSQSFDTSAILGIAFIGEKALRFPELQAKVVPLGNQGSDETAFRMQGIQSPSFLI